MSFLSDYTEKNSNLIPKIDIPCFAWNSQAEQGFLFFKAKSLDIHSFIRLYMPCLYNRLNNYFVIKNNFPDACFLFPVKIKTDHISFIHMIIVQISS